MEIKEYFKNTRGTGVLSTADSTGAINSAIYARPHILSEGQVTFIMADRRSRANLGHNPRAAYLFIEEGGEFRGTRLQLTMIKEEQDPALIKQLRRRTYSPEDEARVGELFLVHFRLDEELPLIGPRPAA